MRRVAIVDDHPVVRVGLRAMLARCGMEVVAEAAGAEEALRAIPSSGAEVVLVDLRLQPGSGIEVTRRLRRYGLRIILLTSFDDDAAAQEGLRAGASGFLLKDVTPERLARAIEGVARGGTAFAPGVAETALATDLHTRFAAQPEPPALTPREGEVLRLITAGWSNREIAGALKLSTGTVKNVASSMMQKLGVRDRTRAALRALELHLLG